MGNDHSRSSSSDVKYTQLKEEGRQKSEQKRYACTYKGKEAISFSNPSYSESNKYASSQHIYVKKSDKKSDKERLV